MKTFCSCPDVHVCIHKRQVGKILTICSIDADKEKCCYSLTAAELKKQIDEVE